MAPTDKTVGPVSITGLYQTTPATTLDYGKERPQANVGAEPIIFTKIVAQ